MLNPYRGRGVFSARPHRLPEEAAFVIHGIKLKWEQIFTGYAHRSLHPRWLWPDFFISVPTRNSPFEKKPHDIRDLPAYGISEAAHYLAIPVATLRSWVHGRYYPTDSGKRRWLPLIEPPKSPSGALSFVNLVEGHVLSAIRHKYRISIPKVRSSWIMSEEHLAQSTHWRMPNLKRMASISSSIDSEN